VKLTADPAWSHPKVPANAADIGLRAKNNKGMLAWEPDKHVLTDWSAAAENNLFG
jgi:hypothetical protein